MATLSALVNNINTKIYIEYLNKYTIKCIIRIITKCAVKEILQSNF